ncbi:MAG: hypothetical protein AAGD33_06045 [Actinomycetota bacterium]
MGESSGKRDTATRSPLALYRFWYSWACEDGRPRAVDLETVRWIARRTAELTPATTRATAKERDRRYVPAIAEPRRGAKGQFTLSDEALAIGRALKGVVSGYEDLELAASNGGPRVAEIRIATLNTPVRLFLTEAIGDVRTSFDGADRIHFAAHTDSLSRRVEPLRAVELGQADYGLISWPDTEPLPGGLRQEELYQWAVGVVAATQVDSAVGLSIGDVVARGTMDGAWRDIHLSPRYRGNRSLIDRAVKEERGRNPSFELPEHRVVETPDTAVRVKLARAGLGVALASTDALPSSDHAEGSDPLLVDRQARILSGRYLVVWRDGAAAPCHDQFIGALKERSSHLTDDRINA